MSSRKKYYHRKIVQSGRLIEVYHYEKPVSTTRTTHPHYVPPQGRANTAADHKTKVKYRLETLKRNRKKIERWVHANAYRWKDEEGKTFLPIFLNLTFEENLQDVQEAHRRFAQFVQRLNYHVYRRKVSQLKYVAVMEFQKRGAIHFHSMFFNLPFIEAETLASIWNNGQIQITSVPYKDIGKVANYMTKSMKKVDERLMGQKVYKKSLGLHEAVSVIDDWEIDKILQDTTVIYHATFEQEIYGNMVYQRRVKTFKKPTPKGKR